MLAFALFLFCGAIGNRKQHAYYDKMDFSYQDVLKKGVEIRRVAVLENCTLKQALRFLSRGRYLVLEVYDKEERWLFNLSQNEFSTLFLNSSSPYETLGSLHKKQNKQAYHV